MATEEPHPTPFRHSPAIPARSFVAQVWDADGNSVAEMDRCDAEGTRLAKLFSAAPCLLAALNELVDLKSIKDSVGKTEGYERRQPLAWEAARAAIAKATTGAAS